MIEAPRSQSHPLRPAPPLSSSKPPFSRKPHFSSPFDPSSLSPPPGWKGWGKAKTQKKWGPGVGPEEWNPEGVEPRMVGARVGARRGGGPKFRVFFSSLSHHIFVYFFPLWGLLVEIVATGRPWTWCSLLSEVGPTLCGIRPLTAPTIPRDPKRGTE